MLYEKCEKNYFTSTLCSTIRHRSKILIMWTWSVVISLLLSSGEHGHTANNEVLVWTDYTNRFNKVLLFYTTYIIYFFSFTQLDSKPSLPDYTRAMPHTPHLQ